MAAIMSIASAAASAVGTVVAGQASAAQAQAQAQGEVAALQIQSQIAKQQGEAAKMSAELEAVQQERQAKEELAQGQQDANQARRQKELALSSLQARSAISGFTANDPTSLMLAGDIEEYGTLQEQMALYGGQSRRLGLESAAAGSRFSGQSAANAARLNAAGYKGAIPYTMAAANAASSGARTSSYLSAGGTILGGASDAWAKYRKTPSYG
jgi:hypothetical protein